MSLIDIAKMKPIRIGNRVYLLTTTFAPLGVVNNQPISFSSIEAARTYIAPKSGWGMYEIKDLRTGRILERIQEGSPQHIKVLGVGFS